MTSEERDRIVAWLIAEFEVQNGIDVSRDPTATERLARAAEQAASAKDKYEVNLPFLAADGTGPKHLHVVLTAERLAAIRDGREGPPHVDRARRSVPPPSPKPAELDRESDRPSQTSINVLMVVMVLLVCGALAFVFMHSGHSHGDNDGHGQEHKR